MRVKKFVVRSGSKRHVTAEGTWVRKCVTQGSGLRGLGMGGAWTTCPAPERSGSILYREYMTGANPDGFKGLAR